MIKKDDWRLVGGEEDVWQDKQLLHKHWEKYRSGWDHDHCEFCGKKLSKPTDIGYCTTDQYYWICEACFNDFKDMFQWKVVEQ